MTRRPGDRRRTRVIGDDDEMTTMMANDDVIGDDVRMGDEIRKAMTMIR